MKTAWNAIDRRELQDRLLDLTPEHVARWGRMTAPQMVAHLRDALLMALGELPVASRRLPIRFPPLKQLIIYWLPFPKGAPTAPELLSRAPRDWPSEVAAVQSLLEQFATRGPAARWPEHPAFGRLSRRAWGVLVYRHMDHHLRQFGV